MAATDYRKQPVRQLSEDSTSRGFGRIVRFFAIEVDRVLEAISAALTTILAGHDILSPTHTDSVTQTVSRGSLIYGNSTPKWDELAVGATSTFLGADGTDASWRLVLSGHATFGVDLDGRTFSP